MAEAIANLILIFGARLFYAVGRWTIKGLSLGRFDVQDAPKTLKAHFVEAWDETDKDGNVIWKDPDYEPHKLLEDHTFHYGVAISVGGVVVIGLFSTLLVMNMDFFLQEKVEGLERIVP